MNLGFIIILISLAGYVSNALNWKYLNYRPMHWLYYIGTFVHESSHALLCLATGAKIEKFKVFSSQPMVVHRRPRIPFIGQMLISIAPIFGGMIFLVLVNHFLLGDYFTTAAPLVLIHSLNILAWQSWVMIVLFFNAGAMFGPSPQDLRAMWPALIVLLFIHFAPAADLGVTILGLILINIALQIVAVTIITIGKWINSRRFRQ